MTFRTLEGSSTGMFPLDEESLEVGEVGASDVAAETSVEDNRKNAEFFDR